MTPPLLCRLRLHRWEYGTATDRVEHAGGVDYHVTTYAWCRRKGCTEPNRAVDVHTRTFNESRVGG